MKIKLSVVYSRSDKIKVKSTVVNSRSVTSSHARLRGLTVVHLRSVKVKVNWSAKVKGKPLSRLSEPGFGDG